MLVRSLAAAALLTLAASAAHADWEGDVEIKDPRAEARGGPPPSGKLRFKEGKLRMDVAMGPMKIVSIVHFKERKSFLINDAAKAYSEMPAGAGPGAQMPHCSSTIFKKCMAEQGMKKVGAEEVNGQACTVWEGDRKGPHGKVHEKLWHPDAAGDEFAMVRAVRDGERGQNEVNVLNWKQAPQEAALFEVPEGYTKSEGFPGMQMGPPGMKGFKHKPDGPTGGEMKEKDE